MRVTLRKRLNVQTVESRLLRGCAGDRVVVCALPLQCITGQGVCARGLAKGNLLKPARQSGARLQDTERAQTAGLQRRAHPVAVPWGRDWHSAQRRQDSVWADQLFSLEVLNCWLGGQGNPPDGPHGSHSLKKEENEAKKSTIKYILLLS